MNSREYHGLIKKFSQYPTDKPLIYFGLGLAGEVGELAEKIKKLYRDHNGKITAEFRKAMVKELGDVEWYKTMIAAELGIDNDEEVRPANVNKLVRRKHLGLLKGEGDDREEEEKMGN